MKFFRLIMMALGLSIVANFANATIAASPVSAQAATTFSANQKAAIENIVHAYLLTHPEVIFEAVQSLQMKQQAEMIQKAKAAITKFANPLLDDPTSPVVGNVKASVSVIEFFDYRCPHCKAMAPELTTLLAQDKNLKIIYKQLPIFGAESEFAAKAALASQKQGKFAAFNDALLKTTEQLTNDVVLKLAGQVGLNIPQLQRDMNNPAYAKEIADNQALAGEIGIQGTPGFIIINKTASGMQTEFIPGQVNALALQKAIAKTKM